MHEGMPQVTRFHDEERISYTVRGANGKLYVSAPARSSEAQMFDEVARVGSEQKKVRNFPPLKRSNVEIHRSGRVSVD